ncbi:MAG: SAM hydroxide adenosyltransferase, partial [Anaerolineaceae bacterium]
QVVLIDIFGNVATNLNEDLVKKNTNVVLKIASRSIRGLVNTYGERQAGDVVALVDSENFIEVAVVNGNAAQKLGVTVGEPVELLFL